MPELESVDRHFSRLTRRAARALVRPVGLALAVLYTVFSTAHLLFLGGRTGTALSTVAMASAAFYLVSALSSNTRWVRQKIHILLAAYSLVALTNSVLHLCLTGNPTEATNIALVFIGVGALIFHTPSLVAVLSLGCAGWIGAGAYWEFSDPYWIHYAFAMISTSVLAVLIYQGRVYSIRQAANLEAEGREREFRLKASKRRVEGELERAVGERTLALRESRQRLELELEERERVEEELRQKHKLEALGRLAGGIAHEFNNILTVLSGNLEMAMDDAESGVPSVATLQEMEWATNRATHLVSQILAFSRMDQATHSVFPLRPLLEETVASLEKSLPEGAGLSLHVQGDPGRLRGSREHVKQVLGNLISNSCQALPPVDGRIQVQASPWRATALESARVDIEEGTPCVRIQISDNGRGIPFQDQDRVFDPFFSTQGIGLGLSVAHGITRSHGGDILLESEPSRGTTVTLVFPTIPSDQEVDEPSKGHGSDPSDTRIIVVDDETAIVRLVTQILTRQGYQVTHFPDPQVALDFFRDGPNGIDLLLTDLSMPKMRGDELGTKIREIRPGFPILIMTGFGGFLDLATLTREGPTSILPKPFSGESLLHAVRGVLRDAQAKKSYLL